MASGNEPEKPKKNWTQYTKYELSDYMLKNSDKADCSFVVTDPIQKNDSKRELRSFKWILSEMSPMLKEILTDDKNGAKNFKSIPITDKNFGGLVSYAHTKSFVSRSFDYMLDLYESSKQYKSQQFTNAIINDIGCRDPIGNWIRFAAIANRDCNLNNGLIEVFRKKWDIASTIGANMRWDKIYDRDRTFECELESNIGTVLLFDITLFRYFLEFMFREDLSPKLCFKTAEAYLIKHIFKGKIPDKIEEEDNITIDHVNNFLDYVNFSKMSVEDFNNGPAKSALLDEVSKKYFRSLVHK